MTMLCLVVWIIFSTALCGVKSTLALCFAGLALMLTGVQKSCVWWNSTIVSNFLILWLASISVIKLDVVLILPVSQEVPSHIFYLIIIAVFHLIVFHFNRSQAY